jgi:serine/threonine protein kinase
MQLTLSGLLGDGAYSDVYAAVDELGRDLAVKVIRPDREADAIALGHAKILSLADHPNIVRVLGIQQIDDPADPSRSVSAVVMERINGDTLSNLLSRQVLKLEEARTIGLGLLDALLHLLARSIAHGDLHSENIMIAGGVTKVIDLMYIAGGSKLTSRSLDVRTRRDNLSMRLILQELLQHVPEAPGLAKAFNDALDVDAGLDRFREVFEQLTSGKSASDTDETVKFGLQLALDPAFVTGDEYAEAVLETIPSTTHPALLLALIEGRHVRDEHRSLIRLLVPTATEETRMKIGAILSADLMTQVPNGSWAAPLRALLFLGADGWDMLTSMCQLRLESVITRDTLNGYVDIYNPVKARGGSLGTWANSLYPRFRSRDRLVDSLVGLLERNWYTQNYVAEFFLVFLPRIATTEDQRKRLISAIRTACDNDAKIVKQKVALLPQAWQDAIMSD